MMRFHSLCLLTLPLGVALYAGSACVVEESAPQHGGTSTSGSGGGTTQPLSPGDAYQSSAALAEAELTRRITTLASDDMNGRDEGTPGGAKARAFIIDEMKGCGIQPAVSGSYEQPITTGQGTNVLGVITGSDPELAARHVVVSAHYDHLGACGGQICNGANDNAAGVAIALAIGCAIAEHPAPRSVLVATWDAEEPPTFLSASMGSQFYVANPVVPLEQIDAVAVMDLVGADLWPGYGGHFLMGSELSPEVRAALEHAALPAGLMAIAGGLHLAEEQPLGLGRQPWSDYDAFRNLGKPILFLSNGQNKSYHTPSDEVAAINAPKVALEAQYLAAIVGNLAYAADTPTFDPAGADYERDAALLAEVLSAALAPGGLIDALQMSAQTRTKLEGDLADAQVIGAKVASGEAATEAEVRRLRDGAQRVMCLAGSTYDESTCDLF